MSITLKGIAWAHTRALAPLQVTSRVYTDFNSDITINWDTRSLLSFGEGGLEELTNEYDFILLDHPFMGMVADSHLFMPLDEEMDNSVLNTLSNQSVGGSYDSYNYNQHQWALPIDAAAQVACSRKDLLLLAGYDVPSTWDEVLALAKDTRKVAMPMAPMGLLGGFFTLCANQGHTPFSSGDDKVVDKAVGEVVLMQLKTLYNLIPSWCTEAYPPHIFNKMAIDGEVWYVPISYGYVNFCMNGYAPHLLEVHNIPAAGDYGCKGSTLGGVGIALSTNSLNKKQALDYINWVTGAGCQRTLYAYSGGQAANKEAWNDDTVNQITNNFYRNTQATIERSFVRPRYNGFHHFQSLAGRLLQRFLKENLNAMSVLNEMDKAFTNSKKNTTYA